MLNKQNLIVNLTKRGVALWGAANRMTSMNGLVLAKNWEQQLPAMRLSGTDFNFAKMYSTKSNLEEEKDKKERMGQSQPKPSASARVANIPEGRKDKPEFEGKAELDEIVRIHEIHMEKLINSFHDQLNLHRERVRNQKLEAQESYQKMIDKLKNERPRLKKLPKLDLAKQMSEERERMAALEQQKLQDRDPKSLAKQVIRLTKDLEAEKEKHKLQSDEYYSLMRLLDTTKSQLTSQIEDERACATKYVFMVLLPIMDALEEAAGVLDANDAMATSSEELQQMRENIKYSYNELCEVFARYKVEEIDCVQKPFDHTLEHIVGHEMDETVPLNTVVSITKKGYMIGGHLLRLAQVVVSRVKMH